MAALDDTMTKVFQQALKALGTNKDFGFHIMFQKHAGDELVAMPSPPAWLFMTDSGKQVIEHSIREVCQTGKLFAYVVMFEAWFLNVATILKEEQAELNRKGISDHPDRQDCLVIIVGGRDRTISQTRRVIYNKKKIRTGYEKLFTVDGADPTVEFTGRFVDLNLENQTEY
jgi:hypothetical protein